MKHWNFSLIQTNNFRLTTNYDVMAKWNHPKHPKLAERLINWLHATKYRQFCFSAWNCSPKCPLSYWLAMKIAKKWDRNNHSWTLQVCQIRCCEFVKRSAETGFSISTIRPLRPASSSLTDTRFHVQPTPLPAPILMRHLPPLKTTPHHRGSQPVYANLMNPTRRGSATQW